MKIKLCYLSTYPPTHCGIANYTYYLVNELLKLDQSIEIVIVAEKGSEKIKEDRLTCIPCFSREENYTSDILGLISRLKPDLIHIQHEYTIYGFNNKFFGLLEALKKENLRVIVTMHEVHAPYTPKDKITYGVENLEKNHRKLGEVVDKILVHSDLMKKQLVEYGVEETKIVVVPHGTKIMDENPVEAKKIFGFSENDKVILSFGFIRKFKKERMLIEALPKILDKEPNTHLLLVGSIHPYSSTNDVEELKLRKDLVNNLRLGQHVKFIEKYVSEDEIEKIFGAADIIVCLHDQKFLEVSGSLHLGIGAGKPIVATRIPRFEEVEKISPETTFNVEEENKMIDIILRLLTDKKFKDNVAEKIKKYAKETSWENIAKKHLKIYREALGLSSEEDIKSSKKIMLL